MFIVGYLISPIVLNANSLNFFAEAKAAALRSDVAEINLDLF